MPRRGSTRKRPEPAPEPGPAPPDNSTTELDAAKQASKKRRASSATKTEPRKRKRNPSTLDDVDSPLDETPVKSDKKPTKTTRLTDKKKSTPSKKDANVTKNKGKASGIDNVNQLKPGIPKNSKVTKKNGNGTKKTTNGTKEAKDIKKTASTNSPHKVKTSKKNGSPEKETSCATDRGSEANYESRETDISPAKERPVTAPLQDSEESAAASTDVDISTNDRTVDEQDADTTAEDNEYDNTGTQTVPPSLADSEVDTELETDIELSLNSSKDGGQRKAQKQGGTPYQSHTLHPNTFLFLQELKENNDRDWLKEHYLDYQQAKDDWESFISTLTKKVTEKDNTIPRLPAGEVIVRIQKDNRSSKDQTAPYKTYFSAVWSRTGKDGNIASYYIRLEPGCCNVGSGYSCPGFSSQDKLALLRRDIDQQPQRLKAVLRQPDMRREFLGGVRDKEEEAVEAFVNLPENKKNAMKGHPKGYENDNEQIQLLRLRGFNVGKHISDATFLDDDGQEQVAALIGVMVPFVSYLNSVIMPDAEPTGP